MKFTNTKDSYIYVEGKGVVGQFKDGSFETEDKTIIEALKKNGKYLSKASAPKKVEKVEKVIEVTEDLTSTDGLEDMKYKDLVAMAKKMGLNGFGKKQPELIELIRDNR